MAPKNLSAPPTAFELGKPSATGLLKHTPNLDVEAARAAMIAAGEEPGNPVTKEANEARREAFRQAQLAGLNVVEAKAAAQNAYDAVINGRNNKGPVSTDLSKPPTIVSEAPKEPSKTVSVRTAADQRVGITQPVTTPTVRDLRAERIDTPQFWGEIKQDGGKWVAELVYKNGAGTERFESLTKNGLMFKLLEGKGHATVQVRRVNNDLKRRFVEYEKTYKFDMPQTDFDKLTSESKQALIAAQQDRAAIAFKEAHVDDYYPSAYNSEKLMEFLNSKQAVVTFANLEKAFEELTSRDELEVRPEIVTPYIPEGAAELEDSNPPATVAPVVSTAPAPVASEPQVRKRGTLGLMPGFSTAGPTSELDETEDGSKPRELSVAELKALSPEEHRRLYKASLAANRRPNRSF